MSAGPHTLAADPARQAFLLLRTVFTVAPILFGLDKFTNILTDWTIYLAPCPVPALAGADVYVRRRRCGDHCGNPGSRPAAVRFTPGGRLAAGDHHQPAGPGHFYDVALRDFGLLVGALALNRLAPPQRLVSRRNHRSRAATSARAAARVAAVGQKPTHTRTSLRYRKPWPAPPWPGRLSGCWLAARPAPVLQRRPGFAGLTAPPQRCRLQVGGQDGGVQVGKQATVDSLSSAGTRGDWFWRTLAATRQPSAFRYWLSPPAFSTGVHRGALASPPRSPPGPLGPAWHRQRRACPWQPLPRRHGRA